MSRDLIIDCFAGGGGASVGIEMALGRPVDIAINHDPDAILMHKTNHPDTLHLTEDIFRVDLKKYVKGRHVALMWASPDCTSHSKAKGGKPRERGLRILPWAVYKHARTILPDVILMENVEEIQQWGPLDEEGHPIKARQGEDYRKFITAMKSLGYIFDCRELIAADYGAPTTRKRWYAIFRRDGGEIVWPVPTHFKDQEPIWKACGDYIDWSDLGKSIFDRKKPLADATMKRIANGIRKYIIDNPSPYIVRNKEAVSFLIQYHGETKTGDSRGQFLTEPIKTIDTSNRYGLVTAFITKFYKSGIGQGCDEPLHTITTSPGHFGLISAFLVKYYGTGGGQELSGPLSTITTKDRFGLINVVLDIEGEKYILKDIFLRMLKPEELKLMQGFPKDYIIDRDYNWKPYPIAKQVARIGNSVVPIMAQKLFCYGVANPIMAIENLTATTLRNIIGDLELDQTLTSRETINTKMRATLDVATDPWGIKVKRVELKNIIPPAAIQDAMEKQMKAERERREAILRAEGEKKSSILVAEGQKESVILDAEAAKQAAILRAEAEKEATIREAEGQAEAILKVQQANADGIRFLKEAGADQSVLTIKSLEAFEKAADGKATKIIIPSEIQGIAGLVKSLAEVTETDGVRKA